MRRMREHVDRLDSLNLVILVEQCQVACLRGRIATYVDNAPRGSPYNGLYHVGVHSGTRRVSDDDVRAAVSGYELVCKDVLHVAGVEVSIADTVDFRINLCVFYGLGHILYADNLARERDTKLAIVPVPV